MRTATLGAVLASLVLGCGVPARHAGDQASPVGEPVAATAVERGALVLPLSAITVRGALFVRTDAGDWQPLQTGASLTGVREVRADRRGAIVALGDAAAAPLVYLRAGTQIRLGQDHQAIHIAIARGRVRVRHGANLTTIVDTAGGELTVDDDAMADAGARTPAEVAPTAAAPAAADWSLALQSAETGAGFGRLEARGRADKMEALELKTVQVDVRTAGDLAITEVTHVFHNASDDRREGTFRFPVPDGALVTGLALEIDGKLVEGEMVERDKAREVYEKVVDAMLDPALLEWEDGNWFKLRVFPLDPNADKKVVIRYVTPLVHGANSWEYDYAISAPDHGAIGALEIKVDGQVALAQREVAQGVDLIVPVAVTKVPTVMREVLPDGAYTAIRIAPRLPALPIAAAANHRLAVVFDTSRSALEGKQQALELLETTLRELGPTDRFLVLASDVDVTPATQDFVAATPDAIAQALGFVAAIEPDGASDLGIAFAALAGRAPSEVIYVGDGIPTWGEQRPDELGKAADKLGAPIEAALIGKGATTALWGELAGKTGGRAMIVKSQLDEKRFALIAGHAAQLPRLSDAHLAAPAGAILFPTSAATVFAGDELAFVMKTPADQALPGSLQLTGKLGGKPYVEDIQLTAFASTERVAQRWARQQLLALEAADAPKEQIVALSTEHNVMSKYTSLLVLENDEMYKQFQIARKNQAAADKLALASAAPQVTGGDLDSLGARQASLSPDEIQPGDPEIKIPAPADARSVVVSFPFGETKLAMWDAGEAAWMVRFLIDQSTPDGTYQVRITITRADGRVEVTQLPYVVDTRPPQVTLSATHDGIGWILRASQVADDTRRKDADRVEVQLPDGTILRLVQTAKGQFEGRWDPATRPTTPVTLRVVVRDHALNQATADLVVQ
jgi:hypothetical protein